MNFLGGVLSFRVTRHFQAYLFIHDFFPSLEPILYDNDGVDVQPKLVTLDSMDPTAACCLTSR